MDAIAMGCLAALFESKVNLRKQTAYIFLCTGMGLSLFVLIFRKEVYQLGLAPIGLNVTLLGFGIALLLVSFHHKNGFQLNRAEKYLKWICLFGKNSYEIYLTHMFVVLFATSAFLQYSTDLNKIPLWYIGILVLSLGLGSVVSKYYSEPLNILLRKSVLLKVDSVQPNKDAIQPI